MLCGAGPADGPVLVLALVHLQMDRLSSIIQPVLLISASEGKSYVCYCCLNIECVNKGEEEQDRGGETERERGSTKEEWFMPPESTINAHQLPSYTQTGNSHRWEMRLTEHFITVFHNNSLETRNAICTEPKNPVEPKTYSTPWRCWTLDSDWAENVGYSHINTLLLKCYCFHSNIETCMYSGQHTHTTWYKDSYARCNIYLGRRIRVHALQFFCSIFVLY